VLYKSNKAISLVEVLITLIILCVGIVSIFNAFSVSLNAVKRSQDITLACLFAEDKLWQIELRQKNKLPAEDDFAGTITMQNKEFKWDYQISDTDASYLKQLKFSIAWQEKREKEYAIEFYTYLLSDK
jgi:type II secretion system protein I